MDGCLNMLLSCFRKGMPDGEGVRDCAGECGCPDGGVPAGDDLAAEPHVHGLAADPAESHFAAW